MNQNEYDDLKAQVDAYAQQDVHLGRVLAAMLAHLGELAGVATEPTPAPAEAPSAPPTETAPQVPLAEGV